eukprot:TRINITY_DN1407_c0_g1_i2.p1 TRINITY_DN1407_c0_g1~~TRINITY_DN1407_c0_g1_i2.p1  ORF type:complete len:452 (-),score=117.22 TRINITY_DN1407_c0_g1_i2:162-1469(-)
MLSENEVFAVVLSCCRVSKDTRRCASGVCCLPRLALLSRQWAVVCCSEPLWQQLYEEDFGAGDASGLSWKERYRERLFATPVIHVSVTGKTLRFGSVHDVIAHWFNHRNAAEVTVSAYFGLPLQPQARGRVVSKKGVRKYADFKKEQKRAEHEESDEGSDVTDSDVEKALESEAGSDSGDPSKAAATRKGMLLLEFEMDPASTLTPEEMEESLFVAGSEMFPESHVSVSVSATKEAAAQVLTVCFTSDMKEEVGEQNIFQLLASASRKDYVGVGFLSQYLMYRTVRKLLKYKRVQGANPHRRKTYHHKVSLPWISAMFELRTRHLDTLGFHAETGMGQWLNNRHFARLARSFFSIRRIVFGECGSSSVVVDFDEPAAFPKWLVMANAKPEEQKYMEETIEALETVSHPLRVGGFPIFACAGEESGTEAQPDRHGQ